MMGLDQIKTANMEAAERAASENRVPFVYYPDDVVSGDSFPFPELGDYVPPGWELDISLFVDSSGFGSPGEPALTIGQLVHEIESLRRDDPDVGFGITDVGQFQLYVGVYRRIK